MSFRSAPHRQPGTLAILLLAMVAAASALAAPIHVRDARGRWLSLPAPPRRIVSLAPSNTEILFALGLGPRIVGVSDYSDYPPAARTKPSVGGLILNTEKILSLRPDLLVGLASLQAPELRRLESLGLHVFAIDPHTIGQTIQAIQSVGAATGTQGRAAAVAHHMRAEIAAVRARLARARSRPKALVVVQWKPLIVVGPGTFMNDALTLAGATNVAADALAPYPSFSVETALARQPDVILLTEPNASVAADPAWRSVPAVRNHRIFTVPPGILERPGPRLAEGVAVLARLLHPRLFRRR